MDTKYEILLQAASRFSRGLMIGPNLFELDETLRDALVDLEMGNIARALHDGGEGSVDADMCASLILSEISWQFPLRQIPDLNEAKDHVK